MFSNSPTDTNVAEGSECKFIEETEKKLGYLLNYTFTPKTFIAPDCWKALQKEIQNSGTNQLDASLLNMNLYTFNLDTGIWV